MLKTNFNEHVVENMRKKKYLTKFKKKAILIKLLLRKKFQKNAFYSLFLRVNKMKKNRRILRKLRYKNRLHKGLYVKSLKSSRKNKILLKNRMLITKRLNSIIKFNKHDFM